jgi:Fanconi anemia group I protein
MFREVPLTDEQFRFVMDKIMRLFEKVEVVELPSLVYQLLLLCTKVQVVLSYCTHHQGNKKSAVIEGIARHMDRLDAACVEGADGPSSQAVDAATLRPVQGTLILHFAFAIKQDQLLAKELFKFLKGLPDLSMFTAALLLSAARIFRFEETVLDILKVGIHATTTNL